MFPIYYELLPESCLIVLAPLLTDEVESALALQLHRAQQSGKPAVWVDFSLLHSVSAAAVQLLWACHHSLQKRGGELVLVHVPDPLKSALLSPTPGVPLCIVPTLLDAARRSCWPHQFPPEEMALVA